MTRSLSDITATSRKLPNRHIWHMVEGWGKTSLAAQTKDPIFIMTDGETGLETLIGAGQLPETPHFPEANSWEEFRASIQVLIEKEHAYKTVVIDTLNGAERMLHQYICRRDFKGEFNDSGFLSYNKGYEVSLPEWTLMLNDLDRLQAKNMTVICLAHTKVKPFRNPEGADFDRYTADMHEKTWGISHKWADVVLFGNFENLVLGGKVTEDGKSRKGKAASVASDRIIYAQRRAAFDAKNRIGLPESFTVSSESPAAELADLMTAVREGRKVAA